MEPKKPLKIIDWEAPEYDHFEKDSDWFWYAGIVGGVLALFAILFKDLLFAIILILGTFTVILYAARPPRLMYFALTSKGLRIKDRLYHYDRLHSFWVSDDNRRRKLIIESEHIFLPHLIIPLPAEIDDEEAREFLLQYLPEVRHEESFVDILVDLLGF